MHQPTSFPASDLVRRFRAEGLVTEVRPNPSFALSKPEFDAWAGDRETFRMEEFYRAQRERFDVLMDGEAPVGGRWNLDADNREPPPTGARTLEVPGPWKVMPPNVVGMSQHADGGAMATKPYSAGGAYLNRMTDHCRGCAFDPKVRVGERACPFTAGYWQWVHRHQELLGGTRAPPVRWRRCTV